MFVARVPAPPLDAAVELLWSVTTARGPLQLERVLPKGTTQLVLNLAEDQTRTFEPRLGFACVRAPGSLLCGPRSEYTIIDTDEQYNCVGAVLRPTGVTQLFHERTDVFADTDASLDAVWRPGDVDRLRTQLLEAADHSTRLDHLEAALRAAWRQRDVHPAVALAVHVFTSRPALARVDEVVAQSGFSARYVIQRFRAAVGLTPKRFCRVQRFQLALQRAFAGRPDDWTTLALDCGFADQAHMTNEFRAFSGLPPTGYLDRRTPWPNHVRFLQDERLPNG